MTVSKLPEPNLPLLRKVLEHIDAHPEEWYQSSWGIHTPQSACGTAFCVAGHAVMLSGEGYTFAPDGEFYDSAELPVHPAEEAQKLLGLLDEEGDFLFAGSNTREHVQSIAEDIAMRASERL